MKVMKLMPLLLLLMAAITSNAQTGELKLDINYSYATPLGNFKNDIISKSSPRGINADFLYGISDKFSAGLGFGFQDFYQKYARALYQTGNHETTSAVLSNSIQVMPVLAKGMFQPLGGSKSLIQPYISLGAGIGIVNFNQYLGEFGGSNNSAGLMLQGGAGVQIPFGKYSHSGLQLGANYNMVSYKRNGYNNLDNLNYQAGVYFPLR